MVFDKTGTLTQGSFDVVAVHSQQDIDPAYLLSMAAHAEAYSDHPIAASLKAAYTGDIDPSRVADVTETSGHGVSARIGENLVVVGNDKLMREYGSKFENCELAGTILHVTIDGGIRRAYRHRRRRQRRCREGHRRPS